MGNTYYVSTKDGEVSFTKIPLGKEEEWAKKIEGGGYGQPCQENLAKLNRPGAAARVPSTSYVMAFLDCPAVNDGVAEYVVALFNQANTDVPVCYAVVNQKNSDINFSGYLTSVDIRKSSNRGYYAALNWGRGDAGFWTKSLILVHITDKCDVSKLLQFESSGMPAELAGCRDGYKGTDIEHKFIDDANLEIIESDSMICDTKRSKKTVRTTKINLDRLAKSRIKK